MPDVIESLVTGGPATINPMSARERDRILGSKVWLINLTDKSWTVHRQYGIYNVPGKKAGEEYSTIEICGRIERNDQGDKKVVLHPVEADEIAADVAHEINGNCILAPEGQSYFGVFVSETPRPKADALAEEKAKLEAYLRALVSAGYNLHREDQAPTTVHKWAAQTLGVKAEWVNEASPNIPCRACHKLIPPNSAKCPECHAVLDMAKMKEFFPLEYAAIVKFHEENQPAPKKPKAKPEADQN